MSKIVSTTAGVLLAAGRGRRMGRLKQLLPWGDSTVVAAAFDALAGHCGAGMVLVAGDDADAVSGALEGRAFRLVAADSDAEQIESARDGLRSALEMPGAERVFLHPADHPVIPAPVLDVLLGHADAQTALIPTYRGRGGHPVLMPACIAASIVSWRPGAAAGGLRAYWQSHPQLVQRVEFPDAPGLVMDLDTPGDYKAAMPSPE
ncbi:MAG: nucleotidyltransferase family protein [Planctomycetota bacterium]|jgi:molybdenum cofactor cytidylyltransferase